MLSRSLTTTVVLALVLAVLMAWAGHTYTLSVATKQPAWEIAQDANHSQGEQEASLSCANCSDNFHSPLTPDHQQEPPQLPSLLIWAEQPNLSVRVDARSEKR